MLSFIDSHTHTHTHAHAHTYMVFTCVAPTLTFRFNVRWSVIVWLISFSNFIWKTDIVVCVPVWWSKSFLPNDCDGSCLSYQKISSRDQMPISKESIKNHIMNALCAINLYFGTYGVRVFKCLVEHIRISWSCWPIPVRDRRNNHPSHVDGVIIQIKISHLCSHAVMWPGRVTVLS